MIFEVFISVFSGVLSVSFLSLLAYMPIAALLIARSAVMKTDVAAKDFCLSLFIVLGVIASSSFPDGFFNVFYSVVFIISPCLLVSSLRNLFSEKENMRRRFFATQGVLAAVFVQIIGGIYLLNFILEVPADYWLIIIIMATVVAMNFAIHVRNAKFPHSFTSVLQGGIVMLAPIAVCCWVVVVDWYGSVLIYFCYCIWITQLTAYLKKVVSINKVYDRLVFSLLILWITIAGIVLYNTSEPWIS